MREESNVHYWSRKMACKNFQNIGNMIVVVLQKFVLCPLLRFIYICQNKKL
jgi:hypothetical protein